MYPFCLFPLVAEAEIEDEVDIHISDERKSEECDEGSQEQEDRAEEEREENERLRDTGEGLSEDPGLWPTTLTDKHRKTIVQMLASEGGAKPGIRNITPKDMEGKPFPTYLQYAKSANGREKIRRDCLIYSESAKALYCIPCLLFSHDQKTPSKSALNSKVGLKTANVRWKKMYEKFPKHETHAPHKQCYLKWKSLQHSILAAGVHTIGSTIHTIVTLNDK